MAIADPKLAPLADELKEFALTLERGAFPKNFFCALCDQLAFDSYKLLCCNKVICSSCHAKLEFPTTCPSCDHSPVEADSCPPNKALRNTTRIWLQKQKKKEESKAASEAPTIEPTPVPSEVQPPTDAADKPVESIEDAPPAEEGVAGQSAADSVAENIPRPASAAPQREEESISAPDEAQQEGSQDAKDEKDAKDENEGDQSVEPAEGQDNGQNTVGPNGAMNPNNPTMNTNGMPNQFGFGYNASQGNFGMGMGMGPMNSMPNMMNPGWNNMGYGMNNMNGMNGMFGFGGNMGMGMNDMSMNYGGGFGNGWNGMGGGGFGFNGYNQMGGYNQSGAYPEMMNQYPKNHMSNQNRFHGNGPGNFSQQRNNRNGSLGYGQGAGMQHNSRPGSRTGLNNRDGESPAGSVDPAAGNQGKDGQASVSAEPGQEGKHETTAAEADSTAEPAQKEGAAFKDVPKAEEGLIAVGNEAEQASGLNQIQTVDSVEASDQGFDPTMMGGNMHLQYQPQMMNQFHPSPMNGPYNHHMGNMGYHHNSFGPRGGFNNAYGAATVLTGEPRGVGVEGAPTGPRAMREGRPNTGFSSRANNIRYNAAQSAMPTTEVAPGSRSPPQRIRSRSPVRDESLRTKDKSPSRSRAGSQARAVAQDEHRDRSPSADPERREDRPRSVTPQLENDAEHEHRREKRRHRSSRYDDYDERNDYDDRGRDDRDSRGSRGDRTRSASADSKYRSRRDKDKYRSSRSHRDRSREHRRRHHSRSRSPNAEGDDDYANDKESSSRRKDRSDGDKYRDRSRDRGRDRDRKDRKDRDYERDYDEEKYRSRDKEKERRRRRDREAEEYERDYDDDKYRSSRRSRKDRDRDHDYEKEPSTSTRAVSPPINAPTGPSADNFSIRGASKPKAKAMPPPQPPTGPRAFMPPKGPAADRERGSRHSRKGSMSSSVPSTPTEPTVQDHYAAEREKNARARDMLERGNPDRSLHSRISSSHSHHNGSSSRPSLSSKRSRDDYDDDEREGGRSIPTGPSGDRSKRRKSGDAGGTDLASLLSKGLRKKAGAPRRGGVKTEGDVERELERVERERDGRRW